MHGRRDARDDTGAHRPRSCAQVPAGYRDSHGRSRVLEVLSRVDAGAESPQETKLRLTIVRAGYPRLETQIPVYNEYGVLIGNVDLGWSKHKIALEYEGQHHRLSRHQFDKDIRRFDEMIEQRWIIIRVTAADNQRTILLRLAEAWAWRVADAA